MWLWRGSLYRGGEQQPLPDGDTMFIRSSGAKVTVPQGAEFSLRTSREGVWETFREHYGDCWGRQEGLLA